MDRQAGRITDPVQRRLEFRAPGFFLATKLVHRVLDPWEMGDALVVGTTSKVTPENTLGELPRQDTTLSNTLVITIPSRHPFRVSHKSRDTKRVPTIVPMANDPVVPGQRIFCEMNKKRQVIVRMRSQIVTMDISQ
jgi:hypothetical protein